MAKSILDPYLDQRLLVKVTTTEELTEKEQQEVAYAVLKVRMREFPNDDENIPLRAIKHAIFDYNPLLARKLLSGSYC